MESLNSYEYGQVVRANMKQDVSASTALEMVIQPEQGSSRNAHLLNNDRPNGAVIATNPDVTVGAIDIAVGDETYLANEYLEYTIKVNDLSRPGIWRLRGTAVIGATNKLLGDFVRFTVLD